jgi:hypothetical protein
VLQQIDQLHNVATGFHGVLSIAFRAILMSRGLSGPNRGVSMFGTVAASAMPLTKRSYIVPCYREGVPWWPMLYKLVNVRSRPPSVPVGNRHTVTKALENERRERSMRPYDTWLYDDDGIFTPPVYVGRERFGPLITAATQRGVADGLPRRYSRVPASSSIVPRQRRKSQ